jgi:hypothetical protein
MTVCDSEGSVVLVVEQDEGGCGDGTDSVGVQGHPVERFESDGEQGVGPFADAR